MKRTIALALGLVALLAVGVAEAAGIVGAKRPTLKIYSAHDGGKIVAEISSADIKFPAPLLTKRSSSGLIKTTLEFTRGDKPPVTGWVRYRSVRINETVNIEVPGCAPPSTKVAMQSRGSRGLGKECK